MELILSFILGLALCFITGGVPAVDTALPVSEPAPIAASAIEEATENAIAIEGIVKERGSDKAVPNATVTATRDSDGAIRTVICDASGYYKLENLPAGAYTITAEAADYEPKSISGMRFTAGTRNKIDIAVKRSMGKDEMIIQTVLDSLGPDLVARMKAAGIELSFDFSYMVKGNDTENGIMIITLEMRSAIGSTRYGDYTLDADLFREAQLALIDCGVLGLSESDVATLKGYPYSQKNHYADVDLDCGINMHLNHTPNDQAILYLRPSGKAPAGYTKLWSSMWDWDELFYRFD